MRVSHALDDSHFDIHVCCISDAGALATRLPRNRVHVLNKPEGIQLHAVLKVKQLINRLRPDVVHTHNLGTLVYGSAASKWGSSVPILHGEHAQLTQHDTRPSRLQLRKVLYRACTKIHTVSNEQLDELLSLNLIGKDQTATAVVNGVDGSVFKPGSTLVGRRTLGLPPHATIVGVVGRLRATKRHDLMIQAMELLPESIHLAIVGDGPEHSSLLSMAHRSASHDRIHFLGHLDHPQEAYQSLDLVVIPSVSEGLSNVLLEAMASEVPVLASDAFGNREVIRNDIDGWLMRLESPDALAKSIQKLCANRTKLAAAGVRARESVLARFEFQTTASTYANIYRSMRRSSASW